GFPFLDSRSRIAMLKETIEVLKGLWGNDKFSYSGKFYHLKEAYCSPKATTPIWVGTFKSGHLMLDLCARLADGINIWGSPPQLRESLEILNELCHKYDRDITKSWSGICIIGKSKEEVMKKVRAFLKPGQSLEDYAEPRLVGTQKEIEEKIKIYEEMGISHFILRFPYLEDAVEF
ncbi:MAG: LLM class flavin-dependent oxidoreductase, partial [Actinomycetota bacterium]